MLHGDRLQNVVMLSRLYHRNAILSTAAATGSRTRRNKLAGAIFLDVARAFVTNGPRKFSESSFLLATGGELLLINRVSSAVRYIHYLAPAAHLFRRPIYLFSAAPWHLASSCSHADARTRN